MIDVLIIGAGPAGVSAALYSKRAGGDVKILYCGDSNLEKTEKIDNYYGFEDGIDGKALYEAGIKQVQNIGVDVSNEEVFDIKKENSIFYVKTEQNEYEAKSVVIATGNKKLRPNIDGIIEFEGKGVSYCAICDGFFFRNKNVAVIGNGKFAIKEANDLKENVSSVTIFTNGEDFVENTEYKIISGKIKSIYGNNKVTGIELENGEKIQADGVFIAVGEAGCTDFAKRLGIALNGESIVVDENMRTNIRGLYACGNATGGLLQICKATYEGAKAGLSAIQYVKDN